MLTQNEKGLDIKYILAAVRKAVMEQDKWNDIRTNRDSMSQGLGLRGQLRPWSKSPIGVC